MVQNCFESGVRKHSKFVKPASNCVRDERFYFLAFCKLDWMTSLVENRFLPI